MRVPLRYAYHDRRAVAVVAGDVALEVQLSAEAGGERPGQVEGEHVRGVCGHHGTAPPTQQKEFSAKDSELTLLANEKNN
jgi:hypothetical protein